MKRLCSENENSKTPVYSGHFKNLSILRYIIPIPRTYIIILYYFIGNDIYL